MERKNIVKEKSFNFAIRVVNICKELEGKREYVLSKQLMRSGTAVGALIRESEHAESKKDFIHKLAIALKEANESDYWIDLLKATNQISSDQHDHLHAPLTELLRLLISIIKNTKANMKRTSYG